MNRKIIQYLIGVLFVIITGLACYSEWFFYLDARVTDSLYQQLGTMNSDIKIIAIDDKTLSELGVFGTWDRSVYAELVEQLTEDEDTEPMIIAFDMIFSEDLNEEGDLAFAEACADAGNVIVVEDYITEKKVVIGEDGEAELNTIYVSGISETYSPLNEVVDTGFAEVVPDEDGIIRQALWSLEVDGVEQSSLSRTIYEKYCETKGLEVVVPSTDSFSRFGFTFSGGPGDYDRYSFIDVLNGTIDTRLFEDSIVMIGAYAEGMQDSYNVACSITGVQMYGVEIQANILQACMEGKTNVILNPYVSTILFMLLMVLYLFMVSKVNVRGAIITTGVFSAGTAAGGLVLYHFGLKNSIVTFPILLIVVCIIKILYTYVSEVRKRAKLIHMFKRYAEPQLVDQMLRDGQYALELEGQKKEVTVLFVDIRGFTSLSEELTSHEIVHILNVYFEAVTVEIQKYQGMLDKFIGDAAMAIFNAPFDSLDYEFRAIEAALGIMKQAKVIGDYTEREFGRRIEFGIGINTGVAVVGNIGSSTRLDYTAIGDTVNIASRLESNAEGGQILITDTVKKRLDDRIITNEIGRTFLKGKKNAVLLHEVTGIKQRFGGNMEVL
ncbi:MAG: adenylate/guanylate cyclase domain-containing protein [Eubacteriales bacterium]